MINYKLLESLAEKIPSAQMLLNSSGYHHLITIGNREQIYSIHAQFHREIFFDFCKDNKIVLSDSLVDLLKQHRRFLVDLDSLSTNSYRIYFLKENFKDIIEYNEFAKHPIDRLDIEQCLALAADHTAYYQKINEKEFQRRIEIVDTNIPIAIMKDDLGRYTLLDGVHRIHALHRRGITLVPAHIVAIRGNCNLVENLVPNSEIDFKDPKINTVYQRLKLKLTQEELDMMLMKNFWGLGIYYSPLRDKATMYKFYFYLSNHAMIQYKIDRDYRYTGKFQEEIIRNDGYFNDSLGIKSLFQNQKVSSNKRLDVDQSYLTVDIRE